MWLVTSFFANYSEALAHPDIDVTCPADTAFLSQVDLDRLDWGQLRGGAWKHSVQTALKQISLEDYYKLCVQRFPQAFASVGVYEAGGQFCLGQPPCTRTNHLCCQVSFDILHMHSPMSSVSPCSYTKL